MKSFTVEEEEEKERKDGTEDLVFSKGSSRRLLALDGGYAEVYKGQSEDEQFVAIKRLNRGSPEEMTVDFLTELGITVHVDRPNIAKVIGHGVGGGMHLIAEAYHLYFKAQT
ncbi:hypothetical protein OIU84_021965 [Salix udensis]|uniref:Serine-threonine/tyrosine-protein kinase catalytic domain-containing protein n=1 Tax=Salix udensis TaxID=889485 RepID=A0AAD6PI14_9ROSI|nr:hypothetical protein OIU84_021965 [Salix udensis]